jgi:hypothetical protein
MSLQRPNRIVHGLLQFGGLDESGCRRIHAPSAGLKCLLGRRLISITAATKTAPASQGTSVASGWPARICTRCAVDRSRNDAMACLDISGTSRKTSKIGRKLRSGLARQCPGRGLVGCDPMFRLGEPVREITVRERCSGRYSHCSMRADGYCTNPGSAAVLSTGNSQLFACGGVM